MSKCPNCNTTFEEIERSGFVGCEMCYKEIPQLKLLIEKIYPNKKHKGRGNGSK